MDEARLFAQRWGSASAVLEAQRLEALRALTETEAARRFALITQGARPVARETSGLVEQQRIFDRLRR